MLTPEDIASRSFLVSVRGYDREEVQSFLSSVADAVAALLQRVDELEELATSPTDQSAQASPEGSPTLVAVPDAPGELFAGIGKETQRILEAAQAAGEDLRRSAREEADQAIETARAEAAQIIADGERRLEAIEREVAALADAREGIAAELQGVGASVARVLGDLRSEAATQLDLDADDEPARAPDREDHTDEVAEPAPGDTPAPAQGDVEAVEAPPADERAAEARTEAQDASASSAAGGNAAASAAEARSGTAERDATTRGTAKRVAAKRVSPPSTSAGSRRGGASTPDSEAWGDDGQLFEDVDPDEAVFGASSSPASEAGERPIDPEVLEEAHDLRARALAPLHPKLVRKLKRALQGIQNDMVDRVRRASGPRSASTLLPDARAIASLAEPAEEFLVSGWRAGAASGGVLAGTRVHLAGPNTQLADLLAEALGEQLVAELDVALRDGFDKDEDAAALGKRIGTVFSELKEEPVESHAAVALLRVYEEGLHAAWTAGGTASRRWAPVTEPSCGDPRCAENHRAGAMPLGEPFPSGHYVPPVRVGCNCTTVPAPQSEPVS